MAVIALIDGEHHPSSVRELLARVEAERGLAGVVFCGGEEKLPGGPLAEVYGRPVEDDPEAALGRLAAAADAVLDLADEPVLPPREKLRLAAHALHHGLVYEAPGLRLEPPRYEPLDVGAPTIAVIATGKRTGKTALAGHLARLLAEHDPLIVCMGRGGPAEPVLVEAAPSLDELVALAEGGAHAASDYLEDAVLAGVPTVGCRRVGGGLAGAPAESNVPAGAALAASLQPGAIMFEGSGSCIPPVEVDRTVCIVGPGEPDPWPSTGCCAPTWSSLTPRPRRRPGRCASSCGPSPPSRCPRTPRWPSSPRARRPARAWTRRWPPPTWPAAARWPRTSIAPWPPAATSGSPSSRRRRSTPWSSGPGPRAPG